MRIVHTEARLSWGHWAIGGMWRNLGRYEYAGRQSLDGEFYLFVGPLVFGVRVARVVPARVV